MQLGKNRICQIRGRAQPSTFPSGCAQRAQPGRKWEGQEHMVGEENPKGWYKGFGIYCPEEAQAQSNSIPAPVPQFQPSATLLAITNNLITKGGNSRNNLSACNSQGSVESRIPTGPSPSQLPACLPWEHQHIPRRSRCFGSWQCCPSSPSSSHPGASLLQSFTRICCSVEASQSRAASQRLQSSPGYCQASGMSQEGRKPDS